MIKEEMANNYKTNSEKLKIGVLATASLPIPPFGGYGGTQRGIYDFIKYVGKRGHDVHLFGPGDSDISGLENITLHKYVDTSLWIPENTLSIDSKKELGNMHYEKSIEDLIKEDKKEKWDVINLRSDNLEILENLVNYFGKERIVYSLHNVRNQARVEKISNLGVHGIAHCKNHKSEHGDLPNIQVIMYGIDVPTYSFSKDTLSKTTEKPTLKELKMLKERGEDYLINLGAIGKHKGQETCIKIALETGNNLILAGTPQDRTGEDKQKYFEEKVVPHVDNKKIIYFGNANEEQKKELLKFSKGFLFPSGYEQNTWNEPFGRAPVEALASGTPVVAYNKGSMKEVIYNDFNGFLFDNLEEAIENVNNLDKITRNDCRRTAMKKFNSERVAEDYEKLFYKIKKNENSF